ncbi:uncharacterized protein LOC110638745 isoform X2 [Hevea brasiliensis]|uniref:uncharacterized protein LOC110638745 isoform X2 n=1 Tax=Hevea brasiliensis TaxID=3981 RepID=UPI0025E80A91|nr:uncharacterized protein LOC110638745 isoform X2 [Hevea brasiliensis]
MGTRFIYSIKTQFDFVNNTDLVNDFVYDNMYRVVSFFWGFVCNYTFHLFGSLFRHIFRFQKGNFVNKFESNSNEVYHQQEDDQFGSSCSQDSETDKSDAEEENSVVMESALSASTNRRSTDEEFQDVGLDAEAADKAEKSGALVKSFVVDEASEKKQEQETLMGEKNSDEENLTFDDGVTVDRGFGNHELDTEKTENSITSSVIEEAEKQELETSTGEKISDNLETGGLDHSSELSVNRTVGEVFESESLIFIYEEKMEHSREAEGVGPQSCMSLDEKAEHNRELEAILMRDQSIDSDDEYIELQPQKQNSILLDVEILSTEDLSNVDEREEEQELVHEKAEPKFEESSFQEQKYSDSPVQIEADYMFEHQDIIEQLKMELKLARTGGLPTILEESESEELETPKTVQKLKPMKIEDQKFERKDLLDGIHKVYKSYSDKMRKLEILNFQTMHSLGLLQMKETVQFQTARKSSVTAVISLLSQNLWLCKGTAVVDPVKKVIADMHNDFETIYVGQLCLSWEILQWQYRKAQELQKYDSQGSHQYNQVAGEFQLFQVLIQRFLENEQFQGPRVENYVKSRCVLRSLLQVPLVRDDSFKDKGKRGDDNEDAITSQMLIETMEQSMLVFWEFLRANKDESSVILQGHQQAHINLQEPVDLELLTDIRSDFQKKDKKLKDILRSGNCIVKRFRKQQEDRVHHIHTLFIAQVELKLVSRVLNMSKLTTDQLIWCHEKLDKINFCNRKVFVESSFLLFPC